jgi:hypothetical protein
MASQHQLLRNFNNFGGLDKRTSDLVKDRIYATEFLNAQQRKSTAIESRKGFHTIATSGSRYGLDKYARISATTGQITYDTIGFDRTPYIAKNSTVTVAYSGSGSPVTISIVLNPATSKFECLLSVTNANVLTFDLGTGVDETTPITLANLKTAIDAVPNFTCTISGGTGFPAALLPVTVEAMITNSVSAVLTYKEWTAINTTVTNPLDGSYTNRNADDFENVSSVNLNGCLYAANGYDGVFKYDGQTFYKVGLPRPAAPTMTLGGTGYTDTSVEYYAVYYQQDAQGNEFIGQVSLASATINPANQTVTVTVPNIVAGSGYNTNCALVNGAQTGVNTITVTNTPHTMKVGDKAYFFNTLTGAYVYRNVTAVTATTIVIDGAAVNVAASSVISNGLRIGILRTVAGGLDKFAVFTSSSGVAVELPNNSFAATQTYADANGAVGFQFTDPIRVPSPPPKARYLAVHQGLLMLAGDPTNTDAVVFSDVGNYSEGFDPISSSFLVQSESTDVIRGIASNNEIFVVFKTNFTTGSIYQVSGDILNLQFRVDLLTKDKGCVSHFTIRDVDGVLYFLSETGVFRMTAGQIPQEVSAAIQPVFTEPVVLNVGNAVSFNLKRAIAVHDPRNYKYLIFLPVENSFNSALYATSDSRVYAYDYYRNAWAEWSNLNFSAGAFVIGSQISFSGRRTDATSGIVQAYLSQTLNTNSIHDYSDHQASINWLFASVWELLEDPSVFKLFLRLKLLSLEDTPNATFRYNMSTNINFVRDFTITSATVQLGSGSLGYGYTQWGIDPYGDPTGIQEPIIKLMGVKAKSLRFLLQHSTALENVCLSGYQLEVALPYTNQEIAD